MHCWKTIPNSYRLNFFYPLSFYATLMSYNPSGPLEFRMNLSFGMLPLSRGCCLLRRQAVCSLYVTGSTVDKSSPWDQRSGVIFSIHRKNVKLPKSSNLLLLCRILVTKFDSVLREIPSIILFWDTCNINF